MSVLAFAVGGLDVPLPVVALGAVVGLTYGLLAVGLVLVYRSNRIVNFAHGEIGAFAAVFFGVAVRRWHLPYYAALPPALVVGALLGAGAEVAVIRRLRRAPRLMSVVATLGVGQLLLALSVVFSPDGLRGRSYPSPPGFPTFFLDGLFVNQAHVAMLVAAPLVVAALVVFLRFTSVGLGIRAAAANPEATRMAGVFAGRMSSAAWALAGAVSAFTAILVFPSRGFVSAESFGPSLLLRALAAAVVGRMTSLPVALAAGVGLGVVEQVALWNQPEEGPVEVALLVIILVALLVQRSRVGREEEKGSWAAVQAWRPLPVSVARLPLLRVLRGVGLGAVLVCALALPLVATNSTSTKVVGMMALSMIGLSVGVLAGLGGQLTLGQFAVGAVGAAASVRVVQATGSFPLGLAAAAATGAAVALLLGLPALRTRGLMLTVTTLSFALVAPTWLLRQSWMFGSRGLRADRPIVFGELLDTGREYYFVALAVLAVVLWVCRNIRRTGFGRLLVAVRDNEENARAFTVRSTAVKAKAFVVAGAVAGIGGAVFGHGLSFVRAEVFPVRTGIDVVAMVVIGGVSLLAGPLLGVLYVVGIPAFLPLDSAGIAATSFGWLLLVLYVPGGLGQLLERVRDRLAAWLAARRGIDLAAAAEPAPTAPTAVAGLDDFRPAARQERAGPILEAVELRKSFGGVQAVQAVSLTVYEHEIVGLIGPNGAGKTTTFEMLGGFTAPDGGRVLFDGEDVTRLGPEERGRRGLIRSFQDAALFPTMTVFETACLAFERVAPTSVLRSVLGLSRAERDKERMAEQLLVRMGLTPYRDARVQELSTGTRRIVELACLVALQPTLLLLDEPSSGIAQRETEALGGLLRGLHRDLGVTLIVIEHDIPLIMGLSDRIVAMDAGVVVADGPPELVRNDPRVVEAYLGGSIEAIERSGSTRP